MTNLEERHQAVQQMRGGVRHRVASTLLLLLLVTDTRWSWRWRWEGLRRHTRAGAGGGRVCGEFAVAVAAARISRLQPNMACAAVGVWG